MPFSIKTMNAFEMTQRDAACELPAKNAGHRRFVGISPPVPDKGVFKWRVRRFEIPVDLIEEYFAEEDLVDSEFIRLDSLEDVERLLESWGIEAAVLDAPWKCDYPF